MTTASTVDEPADFGADAQATASRWISELDIAEKAIAPWRTRAKKIMARYRDERARSAAKRRFAILWSNVQTLGPAVYARAPTAVVGRRFKDADPVGRTASEALERALNFTLDCTAFPRTMKACRDEYLLFARGQAWVTYEPTIEGEKGEDDDDEPSEMVTWEEARASYLAWDDFGHNPARNWGEVRFVYKRACMTRDQLVGRFGEEIGKRVPLDWKEEGAKDDAKDDQFRKAQVYEIWDKTSRKRIFISRSFATAPLEEKPDPLGLKDFFPCPEPLFGTQSPDSLIPVPDFIYYQDQAEEIDELTARIDNLTDALKFTGFYAAHHKDEISQLLAPQNENKLVPVESWSSLKDDGGVKGMIEYWPAQVVAEVIKACVELRKQLIEDVYQVTGIADIMRGQTDPDETLGAQKLKGNWGAMRVRDRQREIARFARDLLRLLSEVIASKFSAETLEAMTNLQLFKTVEEKQQVQQQQALAAQAAQAASQPPQPGMPPAPPPPPAPPLTPQQQRMLIDPTWEEVMQLLKDGELRQFRIDVETDSTVEPDEQQEKAARVEFVSTIGKFMAESLPVIQMAPPMGEVVAESLKFLVRGYRAGREMEDVIDRALDQMKASPPQPPQGPAGPNPQAEQAKAQAAQMNAQANMAKAQVAGQHVQVEQSKVASNHAIGMAQVQAEQARTAADVHMGHSDNLHDALQQAEQRAVEKTMQKELMPGDLKAKG